MQRRRSEQPAAWRVRRTRADNDRKGRACNVLGLQRDVHDVGTGDGQREIHSMGAVAIILHVRLLVDRPTQLHNKGVTTDAAVLTCRIACLDDECGRAMDVAGGQALTKCDGAMSGGRSV